MSTSDDTRNHKFWSGGLLFLIALTLLGALSGAYAFKALFGDIEVSGVVMVGFPGAPATSESARSTEPPSALIIRMMSPNFATKVAGRLNDPSEVQAILPRQYGGEGRVRVRSLRDEGQLEIRVSGHTKEQAQARADAVIAEIIDERDASIAPVMARISRQRASYESAIAATRVTLDNLNKQLSDPTTFRDSPGVYNMLVTAKSQSTEQYIRSNEALAGLDDDTFQRTQILSAPALLQPILTSPLQTAALGGLAGFAFAFVLLQMRKMLV